MTNDEIRIKVAEAMGWTFDRFNVCDPEGNRATCFCGSGRDKEKYGVEDAKEAVRIGLLPNYPEDLNAIHEAIMSLPINKRDQFDVELAVVVHGDFIRHQVRYQRFETTNATASQRCLAYLKTKGLMP